MGAITPEMARVVEEQRLGFVATIGSDGAPNLSPKGTVTVLDDDHLMFADLASPNSVANLIAYPATEVNVVDPFRRKGFRFKGKAEVLRPGDARFAELLERFRTGPRAVRDPERRIHHIVVIAVERALPLVSPAYDDGPGEAEITERWWRYFLGLRRKHPGRAIVGPMETWEAIRARRNVRHFAERPIPTEDLDRILEAARRSPSSTNQQAWDFVVVTERERLQDLSKVWQWSDHVASSAATIALVMPLSEDPEDREIYQYDLGQATMSIMLAAADLGVGSCHASVGDQDLARRVLGLPEDRECPVLISLGYPSGRPIRPIERPDRRAFDDVVHRERW